jgi:hypothetical protein
MSDVPLKHRTGLPPERAGLAKPPYELADTSGQQQFGRTMAHFSGVIFDKLVGQKAANEQAEFYGFVNTALAEWEGYVKNNPGASFEDLQKQRAKMMEGIKAAGQNKGLTGIAKRNIDNWYKENEALLYEKSQGIMEGIRSKQQAEQSDILLDQAIARLDRDAATDIIQNQSGTRYPAETVPLIIKEVHAEIEELEKKAAMEQFGKALIDAAIIKDPEGNPVLDKQGNPTYDWNNAKKLATNPVWLSANDISLKDAASMLSNVKAQVAEQEMRRTAKSDKSVQSQFAEMAMDIDVSDLSLSEYREMLDKAHFGELIEGKTVYTFKGRTSNMPFIDDTDYEELSDAVLKGLGDVLRGAHTRARDMIVAYPDDNAFADFIQASVQGLDPPVANLFRKTANEERQYQFAMVQKYDRAMKLWYAENKDKSGKEIYSHLESKKWEYFNVAKEGIERMKKEVAIPIKIEKRKTGLVRVMSPDGTVGTIPASQLEEALEVGYTEIE